MLDRIPLPSTDERWASVEDSIGAAWGSDWDGVVADLTKFVKAHPNYAPARDKLYSALVSAAGESLESGDLTTALAKLEQARSLGSWRGQRHFDRAYAVTNTDPVPNSHPPTRGGHGPFRRQF